MLPEQHKIFMECLGRLEKNKPLADDPAKMCSLIGNYEYSDYINDDGGEAFIFKAHSAEGNIEAAIKIARTAYNAKGIRDVTIYSQALDGFDVGHRGNRLLKRFIRGARIQQHLCAIIPREVGIIPTIYELAAYPAFAVMEWIEGKTLIAWAKDKKLPDCLKLFCRLLRLCDAVHDCKIVHSDIKPENIMVIEKENEPATPALIDFSLAKDISKPAEGVTQVGEKIFTEGYGSPLMLRDAAKRSFYDDIFMLGKTLQAMYFRCGINDRKNLLSEIEPGIRGIIEQATHLDPKSRYHAIEPFLKDLESYLMKVEKTKISESDDVIFKDEEISDVEKNIVNFFYNGMVKICRDN